MRGKLNGRAVYCEDALARVRPLHFVLSHRRRIRVPFLDQASKHTEEIAMVRMKRAILRSIGTGLVVTLSLAGHGRADAAKERPPETCANHVLKGTGNEGGDDVDLNLSGPCTLDPGTPHKYRNVSILQGGSLVFQDTDTKKKKKKTELTVHSIVIDNGGSLIAGATDAPIGKNGGEVVITFVDSAVPPCDSIWC